MKICADCKYYSGGLISALSSCNKKLSIVTGIPDKFSVDNSCNYQRSYGWIEV